MQKIFFWFRGEHKSISEGQERWPSKKWRSSQLARPKGHGNERAAMEGGSGGGPTFADHFDAVATASTSSPAILPEQKAANGHSSKGRTTSAGGNGRRGREGSRKEEGRMQKAEEEEQRKAAKKQKSYSVRHQRDGSRRKSGTSQFGCSTTEDIPDSRSGPNFDVRKKVVSANEMIGKKPSFLQRIRQRLSARGNNKEKEEKEREIMEMLAPPRLAQEELRMERLAMARAIKEEVILGEERRSRRFERMGGGGDGRDEAGSRREMMMRQKQQQSEELDAFSQGRCSSFDYFSATASPTDQPSSHRDGFDSARDGGGPGEEEVRFATAAEARAYLRRQMAAETGEGHQQEEAAFDADDEISNRLTTSAAIGGDLAICQLQRPHSAMSTSSTVQEAGRHNQRESIYFTVVQPGFPSAVTLPLSPPSSPPDKPPNGGQADQQQQPQFELSKHRSKSQQILAGQLQDSPLVGQGSEPGSIKSGRRKLRFVIPQVSICSVDDDNCMVGTAEDEANNNNRGDNLSVGEDSLNNNQHQPGSSAVLAPLLPAMLGVGPEAEEELKKAFSQMDKKQMTLAQRRQSNMDVVHQASGRRTSTTLIPLTSAQIHLIRSLWRQVYLSKGPTVIGSQISHRLFFKEPQTREQFRRCPLPQQYVNHDSFSKAHCKKLSEMIDQVVESLDDLENVSGMLERVGRAHARISGGQLSSKLWNSVAETFIDCTLEWGDRRARSETVRKAWALIIAFMIERIKHGHLEERRQITAIRSTIASLERFAVGTAGGGSGNGSAQQSPSQLSVQMGPIRRVSATATLLNGITRPVKFSPDQFRSTNSAYIGASTDATSIVSPVANRRKPLRIQPSPRSGRTRSDAERPKGGMHSRKGSAEADLSSGGSGTTVVGGGGGCPPSGATASTGQPPAQHTDV